MNSKEYYNPKTGKFEVEATNCIEPNVIFKDISKKRKNFRFLKRAKQTKGRKKK